MAVGEYHYRRQNIAGAKKSYTKALRIYYANPFRLENTGLSPSIINIMEQRMKNMTTVNFKPLHFPLTNDVLHRLHETYVPDMSFESFLEWRRKHNVTDEFTINKHLLRNRQQVVSEREAALKKRKHQN